MLHTTGRAGGQPKRRPKKTSIKARKLEKVTFESQNVRILILKFYGDYKKMASIKNDLSERSEQVWIEKWFRSENLI